MRVPSGDSAHLFQREHRKDQMRKSRFPSERFGFVERESENAGLVLQQRRKLALNHHTNSRYDGEHVMQSVSIGRSHTGLVFSEVMIRLIWVESSSCLFSQIGMQKNSVRQAQAQA